MRAMLIVLLCSLSSCAVVEPTCSSEIDRTGRRVPLCSSIDESPVCDDPGRMARFERDAAMRLMLIDGALATCDAEGRVVCPDGERPYCLLQPPVP